VFEREPVGVMSVRSSSSDDNSQEYLSKKVSINGQTVTLYSSNGQTWFSSPEEIPEVMARLENTRILLNDPKGEAAPLPPKATSAKYRLRGPKPRPILQTEGGPIKGTPVEPISSSTVEVKMGGESVEVVSQPGKGGSRAGKAEPAKPHKKLVAPVSTGPKPPKVPVAKAVVGASSKAVAPKKIAASKTTQVAKAEVASQSQKRTKAQISKPVTKKAGQTAAAAKASPKRAAPKKPAVKKGSAVKKKR
jgi:hypothetical protein